MSNDDPHTPVERIQRLLGAVVLVAVPFRKKKAYAKGWQKLTLARHDRGLSGKPQSWARISGFRWEG